MANTVYTVYKAKWASDVAGKSDVEIEGITQLATVYGGNVQAFFADGNIYPIFGWIENVSLTAQLTTADKSLLQGDHNLETGDPGALTIQFPERKTGIGGLNTDAGKTLLCYLGGPAAPADPNQDCGCMIGQIGNSGGHSGAGTVVVDFVLTSVDGVTAPITISMDALDDYS